MTYSLSRGMKKEFNRVSPLTLTQTLSLWEMVGVRETLIKTEGLYDTTGCAITPKFLPYSPIN